MHVILDFDGTLVDSKGFIIEIYNSVSKGKKRPHITDEIFGKLSKMSIFKRLKHFDTSLREVTKIFREIENVYYENAGRVRLFNGIKELIEEIAKKHTLYILSTNTIRVIRKVMQDHLLDSYFTDFYTNRNLLGKAGSLKKILRKNSISAFDTVYIGDEERDIIASKKVKVKSLAVSWGYDSKALLGSVKPDYIVDEPGEIKEILGMMEADAKS